MSEEKRLKVLVIREHGYEADEEEQIPELIGFVYKYDNVMYTTYFRTDNILNDTSRAIN